jgi:hypothetical protein
VPSLVGLLIRRMQIVVVQNLKDPKSILQYAGQYFTLVIGQVSLVRHYIVNGLERLELQGTVCVGVLGEEGLGDLVSENDAFL